MTRIVFLMSSSNVPLTSDFWPKMKWKSSAMEKRVDGNLLHDTIGNICFNDVPFLLFCICPLKNKNNSTEHATSEKAFSASPGNISSFPHFREKNDCFENKYDFTVVIRAKVPLTCYLCCYWNERKVDIFTVHICPIFSQDEDFRKQNKTFWEKLDYFLSNPKNADQNTNGAST